MSQSFAEALSWVPVSAVLSSTLGRAYSYAQAQGHRTVTLEHLLLALAEDVDAGGVLQASNIDVGRLSSDASAHLGHNGDRIGGEMPNDPTADESLVRILDYAAAAARQSKRREINGAIVLAAIVGEAHSAAASMLQAQGLTFEGAVRALQRAAPQKPRSNSQQELPTAPVPPMPMAQGAPPAAAPVDQPTAINGAATQTNEQILASVRRRIDANRTQKKSAAGAPARDTASLPTPPTPAQKLPSYPPQVQTPAPSASPVVEATGPALPQMAPHSPVPPSAHHDVAPTTNEQQAQATLPPMSSMPSSGAEAPAEIPYGALTAPTSPPSPELSPPRPQLVARRPDTDETNGFDSLSGAVPEPPIRAEPPPWQDAPLGLRRPPPLPPGMPTSLEIPGQLRPLLPSIEALPSPLRPKQLGAPVVPPSTVPWPAPVMPQPAALPSSTQGRRPPSALQDPNYFDGGIAGPPYPEPDSVPPQPIKLPKSGRSKSGPDKAQSANGGMPIENIPRTMQVGRSETVEIRIARSDVAISPTSMPGGGSAGYLHDLIVTKAISVRLRGADNRFQIEAVSPETQWLDNDPDKPADDFASWRWNVTPLRRGKGQLQLVIGTRTIATDGLSADTALPEQTFDIAVARNYGRTLMRAATWAGFMLLGALLSRLGQTSFETVATMWRGFE